MSLWVKVLEPKSGGLCWIPRMKEKNLSLTSCTLTSTNLPWHTCTCHNTHTPLINQSINKQTVWVYFLPQVYKYVSNFSSVNEKRKLSTLKLQTCLCCRINRLWSEVQKLSWGWKSVRKAHDGRAWESEFDAHNWHQMRAVGPGEMTQKLQTTCSSHREPGFASKLPKAANSSLQLQFQGIPHTLPVSVVTRYHVMICTCKCKAPIHIK